MLPSLLPSGPLLHFGGVHERIVDKRLGICLRHMTLLAKVACARDFIEARTLPVNVMRLRHFRRIRFDVSRPVMTIHASIICRRDLIASDFVRDQRRLLTISPAKTAIRY